MTNTIFAASYGNGVYESTNAGASWSLLSGGPTDVITAAVSSTGVYYAVDNGIRHRCGAMPTAHWTKLLMIQHDVDVFTPSRSIPTIRTRS